jgi:transposase
MEQVEQGRVRLKSPERSQVRMECRCLDDLLAASHPARVVWEVSGRLDLSAFAAPIKARDGVRGRDATDPRLLFSLWLLGATRGIGSARELARRCESDDAFKWMCGGVGVNYHTLADFRVRHGEALDELFTAVLASLVEQGLVKVWRVSQDGTRVRACAGAASFRREERLTKLLEEARGHVRELKGLLEDPARSGGLSARKKAARERAARERVQRLERAVQQLPELKERQKTLARKEGDGSRGGKGPGKAAKRQPRASSTDPEARVMKMGDGGFRPAVNVQLAVDTDSRAVVGVGVTSEGSDNNNLSGPMRRQVEGRTGQKVGEHLMDGGYLKLEDVRQAAQDGVDLYVPPKPPRNPDLRGSEYEPRPTDTPELAAWRARMGSREGKAVYKLRASTVETANADLKTRRGLVQLTVRGLSKARCVALWSALAYNVMHFAAALLS